MDYKDLLNLCYFFITISIILPTFLITFGNEILDSIQKNFIRLQEKARYLCLIPIENHSILLQKVTQTETYVQHFIRMMRIFLAVMLFMAIISLIFGVTAIVSDCLTFFAKLEKVDTIIALLILNFLLFYFCVVYANIMQPSKDLENLRQYMMENCGPLYYKQGG